MNTTLPHVNFGILSGRPGFESLLEGDQRYLPTPERYETAFRDIFARQYYTNQGPLTSRLEERLCACYGVRHAVCVTNATIGLLMAAEAMELKGRVVVPALISASALQSLIWVGLEPLFCDVDPVTHQIDIDHATDLLKQGHRDIAAILAVNLWGNVCDAAALRGLADRFGMRLYFDSVHAFTTGSNIDALAARLRNIRSSYGAGTPVAVAKTSNGRMSEAQAALGLMHLDDFPQLRLGNLELFHRYENGLRKIPGLHLLKPVDYSSFAYLVCEVDDSVFGMNRDCLLAVLKAENVNARHHPSLETALTLPTAAPHLLPRTAKIVRNYFQLPLGTDVSTHDVDQVCSLIAAANAHAATLTKAMV